MSLKESKGRVIIYAPNSHVGGGVVLLKGLIKNWPKGVLLNGYFDSRAAEFLGLEKGPDINWVEPKITSRIKAEISLSKIVSSDDVVLFMNSLPPLFECRARVIVFLQNRNLVESISLREFKFRQVLRIATERTLAFWLRSRADEYIVQTDSFKRDLEKWYKGVGVVRNPIVTVLPFMESCKLSTPLVLDTRLSDHDFIYVADGLAHKNHLALFNAWEVLAGEGVFPSLAITLPDTEMDLLNNLAQLQKKGIKIINLGWLPHSEVLLKYEVSRALIFPSLRESFGLPLVEACKLNIPILASELDYVYDVCEPEETFDPTSPRSIGRAVKRFLDIRPSLRKIEAPESFVSYIFRSKLKSGNFSED